MAIINKRGITERENNYRTFKNLVEIVENCF
jgi:hypothetical protein